MILTQELFHNVWKKIVAFYRGSFITRRVYGTVVNFETATPSNLKDVVGETNYANIKTVYNKLFHEFALKNDARRFENPTSWLDSWANFLESKEQQIVAELGIGGYR